MTKVKEFDLDRIIDNVANVYELILYNDDNNSFDDVIIALIAFCKFTTGQAVQCATIVHNNGQHVLKRGRKEDLQEICQKLLAEDLIVKIVKKDGNNSTESS